jgi:murein tripeptide amidase MpaA
MKLFKMSLSVFLCLFFAVQVQAQEKYIKARFTLSDAKNWQALLNAGLDADHDIIRNGSMADCILTYSKLVELQKKGFSAEILINDMENYYAERSYKDRSFAKILEPGLFRTGSMGGFYTLLELYQQMDRMKEFAPEYISGPDTIGFTHEKRPILAWKINSIKDTVPATLYTSLHHSREPGGATTLFYFLWDLLEKAKSSDKEALWLLNNRSLHIVPLVNPDGYAYNQERNPNGGGLWRKNRLPIGQNIGVDLNRNYGTDQFWDAPNNGSSTNPADDTYRGEAPFSEPETQAIRDLFLKHKFGFALNYHTFSNLLIYPYAALSAETPDSAVFRGFAADVTRYNKYSTGRDLETVGYTTRGNSDDWMYAQNTALSYTPEVGSIFDGFWPQPSRIVDLAKENLYMNYQALWSSGANIRMREFVLTNQNPKGGNLEILFQNTGRRDMPDSVYIAVNALKNITFSKNTYALKPLASGAIYSLSVPFGTMNGVRNGDTAIVQATITQHGISRLDTLRFLVYLPEVSELYSNDMNADFWNLNGWGTVKTEFGDYALTDSPQGNYQPGSTALLETRQEIDLSGYRNAELSFRTRWSIEPRSDFGTVEISTNNGRTWEYLISPRMKQGTGIPNSRQDANAWGLEGNFPEWELQHISLSQYTGKKIKLRFSMLADEGAEFDGWYLRSIQIKGFTDSMSDISRDIPYANKLQLDVFPSPAQADLPVYIAFSARNAQLSAGVFTVQIFDAQGKMLLQQNRVSAGGNEELFELNTSLLPAGTFVIKIQMGGQSVQQNFILMR